MIKRLFLLLLTIVAFYFSNAQVSVANTKENVVYIGAENIIEIAAFGYDCKNVDVVADRGTLKRVAGECGKYVYTTNKLGAVKFTIVVLKNKKVTSIDNVSYRVKYPPLPKAYVIAGNYEGVSSSLDDFRKTCRGLGASLDDFEYEIDYRIESFTYAIVRGNDTSAFGSNTSAKFNSDFKEKIKLVQKGDKIFFTNIYCKANFKDHIPLDDYVVSF